MQRRYLPGLILALLIPVSLMAQSEQESPIPYFRYSVTAGIGATQLYSDLDQAQVGPGGYLRGNYFLRHGLSVGLELQEGLLRGVDDEPERGLTRRSLNFYHAATLGFQFQPVKFLQDDHLRRIEYRNSWGKRALSSAYIGAGIGALYSLQWNVRRVQDVDGRAFPEFSGKNHGLNYLANANVGIELPLHNLKPNLLDSYVWNLVVNAQLNFAFDDELDGYSGESPANNTKNDTYGFLSLGVNLRF
ncbi:outer membrane beta-barrel protein [Parapedobacter lycopersici]|uniref:outer membrane beta-barrel protein n=1 Tax=Parapedobacter lycopersici TaxID=1864939 RepID=UPI00333E9495